MYNNTVSERIIFATAIYKKFSELGLDKMLNKDEIVFLKSLVQQYVKDEDFKANGHIAVPVLNRVITYTFSKYKPPVVLLERRLPSFFSENKPIQSSSK